MQAFDGFVAADFGAFEERKWSSHAFNRERLEVKLKLAALGRELLAGLEKRLGNLDNEVSDERPSVFNDHRVAWLSWRAWRGGPERHMVEARQATTGGLAQTGPATKAAAEHFHFEVWLAAERLRVGLVMPARAVVDWRNLEAALADEQYLAAVLELLQDLSADVSLDDGAGHELDLQAPTLWQERLASSGQPALWLARAWEPAELVEFGAGLVEILQQHLTKLVPAYQALAWQRDNDRVGLVQKLKLERQQAAQKLAVGVEVRILGGLAAGRQGVIEEMLRHGQVAVRLGNLVLTMKADEVEPLAGRREKRR